MGIKKEIGEAFEKGISITKNVDESKQGFLVRELYITSERLREIEIPTDKEDLELYNAAMDSVTVVAGQLFRRTITRGQFIDIEDYLIAITKQLLAEVDGKYSFEGFASFVVPQAPITFSRSGAKKENDGKDQKTLSVFSFVNKRTDKQQENK